MYIKRNLIKDISSQDSDEPKQIVLSSLISDENQNNQAENDDEKNKKPPIILIPQEIYDPADLIHLDEWIYFLYSKETNIYYETWRQLLNWSLIYKIMPYLSIIMQYSYLVFDREGMYISIVKRITGALFTLASHPFFIILSYTVPFYKTKRFAYMKTIRWIKIGKIIVISILLIVMGFIIIFQSQFITSDKIQNLSIQYNDTEPSYSFPIIKTKPLFCTNKIGELDIVQASALNTFVFTWNNETLVNETIRFITQNRFDAYLNISNFTENKPTYDEIPLFSFTTSSNVYQIFGINLTSKEFGCFIELLTRNLSLNLVRAIVPFFNVMRGIFTELFSLVMKISQYFFGIQSYAEVTGESFVPYINEPFDDGSHYVISRSIYATFIKALNKKMNGILFNNIELPYSFSLPSLSPFISRVDQPNMISVNWKDSIYANTDTLIQNTDIISTPFSSLKMSNPFHETCYLAAICDPEKWYNFCIQVLAEENVNGTEKYEYFIDQAYKLYN